MVNDMRRHSEATLMGLTKKELVEYVRMAEYNQDVAEETLKQQIENVKDWMPVMHGRWEEKFFTNDRQRVCSVCHCTVRQPSYDRGETALFKYCPHCGAKMDSKGGNT